MSEAVVGSAGNGWRMAQPARVVLAYAPADSRATVTALRRWGRTVIFGAAEEPRGSADRANRIHRALAGLDVTLLGVGYAGCCAVARYLTHGAEGVSTVVLVDPAVPCQALGRLDPIRAVASAATEVRLVGGACAAPVVRLILMCAETSRACEGSGLCSCGEGPVRSSADVAWELSGRRPRRAGLYFEGGLSIGSFATKQELDERGLPMAIDAAIG